jgi:glutamate N-acetyltransferase/amino-acid N-acetyltransferase
VKSFSFKEGIPGFLFSGISSGIKKDQTKDLGLIVSTQPCTAAGVFTKNRVKAAPVLICRKRLQQGPIQAVLANSGNANVCNGGKGLKAAKITCANVSSCLGIKESLVVPCSTGIIGVPLPSEKIIKAIPKLVKKATPAGISDFAESILTTDTYTKIIACKDTLNGEKIKVCGIAKGAGMIMPDMATMLAFIVSNIAIEKTLLSQLLKRHVEETFNRITVDGDMSTNDTVLVLANGQSRTIINSPKTRGYKAFETMLYEVMKRLSYLIVKDGEGATKLINILVMNAKTASDAKKAALKVANSCLVKTAFFGEDFNWGRIMAALGSSGVLFNTEKVAISLNNIQAVYNGQGIIENIAKLKKSLKKKTIQVTIDLKKGGGCCEVSTCDLSFDYVKINAAYTT